MSNPSRRLAGVLLFPVALTPFAAHACSSCGCSVGTEWAGTGYSDAPGLRMGLRFDFVNQDELRHGTHEASASDIRDAIGNESAEEQQTGTLTRFYTLSLDYGFNRDWAVNVQLPYLDRSHGSRIAEEEDDGGDGTLEQKTNVVGTDVSTSSRDGIGDVRVIARYQGLFDDRSLGLQFGLKLPTGEDRQHFSDGPARGELLDKGLQLGTGTTDAIVGVYHFRAFARDWDHFEEAQVKVPLGEHDDFKPGTQVFANAGVRYLGLPKFVPQLQLNYKHEGKESGELADRPNSGSDEFFVAPGLTWNAVKQVSLYGFVQLPLYRDFRGLQLAPHYTATAGVNYSF